MELTNNVATANVNNEEKVTTGCSCAAANQAEAVNTQDSVRCDINFYPEDCGISTDITINGCKDSLEYDAGDVVINSLGRILQLDATLKNICPNKKVALGILIYELDSNNNEYRRGLKTIVVPAHNQSSCIDINVKGIKFVLPEQLDVSGNPNSICNNRYFRAKLITHYIDNDYDC